MRPRSHADWSGVDPRGGRRRRALLDLVLDPDLAEETRDYGLLLSEVWAGLAV